MDPSACTWELPAVRRILLIALYLALLPLVLPMIVVAARPVATCVVLAAVAIAIGAVTGWHGPRAKPCQFAPGAGEPRLVDRAEGRAQAWHAP